MNTAIRRIRARSVVSLPIAFGAFAAAGSIDTALGANAHAVAAAATVTVGCLVLAAWTSATARTAHASLALGCWLALLAVAPVHVVGPLAIGTTGIAAAMLEAATWAAALGAVVSTVYLGFREFGTSATADYAEDVLDGEPDY
ncbi:hypothetical protein [Halovivax sp.]|uniref:hypothetical protein n=1 Tax=Halovivax sp. TaxID=1935978 RepID=UPI0025C30F9A|nr:hypothetical protein [Halovivax sp.]